MASNRRQASTQVGPGPVRWLAALLVSGLLVGCSRDIADTLTVRQRLPLPDSMSTRLDIDEHNRIWLSGPGQIVRLDSMIAAPARLRLRTPAAPTWLSGGEEHVYFQVASTLGMLDLGAASDSTSLPQPLLQPIEWPAEAVAVDPRGRFLYRTAEAGSLVAHDLDSLIPRWGWAAVGAEGTALSLSPGGDYLFEATTTVEEQPELLVRDVQTGRILRRIELSDPARTLFSTRDGSVYAVGGSRDGGSVAAFGWRDGELERQWQRSFGDFDVESPVRAALSPSGRLLAILGIEQESGLYLLDTGDGRTIERLRGPALDIGFDRADRPFLLVRGELRRLE